MYMHEACVIIIFMPFCTVSIVKNYNSMKVSSINAFKYGRNEAM
jgi:hypothetical protein